MTQLNQEDFLKGDLKWNVVGGKQILVTYEHSDLWTGPAQAYVGNELPNTIRKLSAHEPLKIVAFGDSITFGIGSSRILKIPPFQPPWIELFSEELGKTWNDQAITLYNSSQSGADSKWAKSMAQRMVASLDPDLVVVAFGQNDFWRIQADAFASNISALIESVRSVDPRAEFLLVSTMRFDPAYSSKGGYWDLVGQYELELRALVGPGVQLVDFTTISGAVFAAKAPKDCLNDPLHPDDYLSRWYAQSLVAALVPSAQHQPVQAPGGLGSAIVEDRIGPLSH
jgi:lysophospholipase L1-like esterase